MRIGILGLSAGGKTTVFNVLARAHAKTGTASVRGGVNVGVVDVPDPRLEPLTAMFRPKKTIAAKVEYIDQAATSAGESYAPALYQADLLAVVLRAFDDPATPHPLGSVDPVRDARNFLEDVILRDLALIEARLE